jgi:hypothetical protein
MCRIGNGVSYNEGVSPGGRRYYDAILALAADKYTPHVMVSLLEFEIRNRLGNATCRKHAKDALTIVKANLINQRLLECLDYLLVKIDTNQNCASSAEFRKLSTGYINWG